MRAHHQYFSALCLYFSLITTVLLTEPTELFGGGACGGGGYGAWASMFSDWSRGLFGGVSLCDQEVQTGMTGAQFSKEQTHTCQKSITIYDYH